jgi:hypothetical protein
MQKFLGVHVRATYVRAVITINSSPPLRDRQEGAS